MDPCDIEDGRCYAYCPRSHTDMKALQESLFDAESVTPELGPVVAFYMTRAADEEIRSHAQHGGTVTALLALALQEKVIDSAIVADEADLLPHGAVVSDAAQVLEFAKTEFVVSPTLSGFEMEI
jgi:coenzyme F420 hydrogenase subunit beta